MSGMLERVARALYEADDPWHKAWPWPDLNPGAQGGQSAVEAYRNLARAALEAMREPTRGMLSAGSDDIDYSDFAGKLPSDGLAAAWSRMIGEAIVGVQDEFDALSPTEAPTASATGRAADHSGVAGLGGE